jgi:hypothetical protein
VGRLLLRLVLVFGGIAAVLILVQRFAYSSPILFYALVGGAPLLILFVVFAALYQRPRDR